VNLYPKHCVLLIALLTVAVSTSADTNEIPNIEEEARRTAWLFLDNIPGNYDIFPFSAPSGGIAVRAAPQVHASTSRSGTRCPALLYVILENSLRSEYETIIDTWNTQTIIPNGTVVFYENTHDEKTDSFWLRETIYDFEKLKIRGVSINPGQFLEDQGAQHQKPTSLDGGLAHIVLQFEKMTAQSMPLSGSWPATTFSIEGLPLSKRADKSCGAIGEIGL
jgi:hypothetical protein